MSLRTITDENGKLIQIMSHKFSKCYFPNDIILCFSFFFYLDYQTCVRRARSVNNDAKQIICPNYHYVFYAELEINLNWNIQQWFERWYLYFTEISLPPGCNYDPNLDETGSSQVFLYAPDQLIIYHNAKTKYRCKNCSNEWTSARSRAIFQAEIPQINKYNFLFVNLCTQQCRYCKREIQPSWYIYESTRVMKNVCRILIEKFYSNQHFQLPRLASPSSSSSEEENQQRRSKTIGHHCRDLCVACQRGCCHGSHRRDPRRN